MKLLFLFPYVFLLFVFAGCAPRSAGPGEPTGEPETAAATPTRRPLTIVTATPAAAGEDAKERTGRLKIEGEFDPENPDWKLRYRELYNRYLEEFEPPETGGRVEVLLAGGNMRRGILEELHEDRLKLKVEEGSITLRPDALGEASRKRFFRPYFAHTSALDRGRVEYRQWRRREAERNRGNPTPTPGRTAAGTGSGIRGVDARYDPDPEAEPPRNEGPKGRVWQVDRYLRQHTAVPHSLKYKAWGPVRKHGRGYKVRVQYSVDSAEGFGTSHEDMMFFMHSDGKVYRRAPVK